MVLLERFYEEKCGFICMKVDMMVIFIKLNGKEWYEGCCRNLSGVGMLFEIEKKLMMGDRFKVIIFLEGFDFMLLDVVVEVVCVILLLNLYFFWLGVVIK